MIISLDEILIELRKTCQTAGGQSNLARQWGIAQSHISEVLSGKVAPGPTLLRAMGVAGGTVYRRVNNSSS